MVPVGLLVTQRVLGDQDLLDVGRALAVVEHVRIHPVPRHPVFARQAVAAEDLLCLVGAHFGRLRSVVLGDRRDAVGRLIVVHRPGRTVDQRAARFDGGCHLGDRILDHLVPAQWLLTHGAFVRVARSHRSDSFCTA